MQISSDTKVGVLALLGNLYGNLNLDDTDTLAPSSVEAPSLEAKPIKLPVVKRSIFSRNKAAELVSKSNSPSAKKKTVETRRQRVNLSL